MEDEAIERGTGDVFRDLGFENPEEHRLRVRLAMRINELVAERGWTQVRIAELLGISQPHVSDLKRYRLSRFSSERLLHFLTHLDQDVEIRIRDKAGRRKQGSISVSVLAPRKLAPPRQLARSS
jgi:predicted XRE-type DNA-binding protein